MSDWSISRTTKTIVYLLLGGAVVAALATGFFVIPVLFLSIGLSIVCAAYFDMLNKAEQLTPGDPIVEKAAKFNKILKVIAMGIASLGFALAFLTYKYGSDFIATDFVDNICFYCGGKGWSAVSGKSCPVCKGLGFESRKITTGIGPGMVFLALGAVGILLTYICTEKFDRLMKHLAKKEEEARLAGIEVPKKQENGSTQNSIATMDASNEVLNKLAFISFAPLFLAVVAVICYVTFYWGHVDGRAYLMEIIMRNIIAFISPALCLFAIFSAKKHPTLVKQMLIATIAILAIQVIGIIIYSYYDYRPIRFSSDFFTKKYAVQNLCIKYIGGCALFNRIDSRMRWRELLYVLKNLMSTAVLVYGYKKVRKK